MGNRLTLSEVLADFGATLQSLSLRTVAYCIEKTWYNLVSVIDFSEQDSVSLEGKICDEWNMLGAIDHERLSFRYEVFSYDCRSRLFHELQIGLLQFKDIDVKLSKTDLLSLLGNINSYAGRNWPQFQLNSNAPSQDISQQIILSIKSAAYDVEIQRYLSTVPYDSLSEAIAFYMHLMNDSLRSYEGEVLRGLQFLQRSLELGAVATKTR